MAIIRSANLQTVAPQAAPNAMPQANADIASFGGTQARDAMVAGQQLEKASDSLANVALAEMKEANDTKVESDLNSFIQAKQKGVTDFVQLKGQDAITGAEAATNALIDLKKQAIDGAANGYQRKELARRLDAQFNDATGTITTHVSNQTTAWQKDTLAARGALIDRDGVLKRDDPNAIDGQLAAKVSVALERAKLEHGAAPDSEIAKEYVFAEQSKYLKGVIQAKLDDQNPRAALALYEKYSDVMKRDPGVVAAMKGVKTQIDGENAANGALVKIGLPQIRSNEAVGPVTPNLLHRVIVGQESGGQQTDAKGNTLTSIDGAKGAGQMIPETFKKFALAGERIDDKADNLRVSGRIIDTYFQKYAGDPQRVAVAYFSGEGNVAPAGSPTPWIKDSKDGNGKSVSSYVSDITSRIGGAGASTPVTYKGDLKAGYEQAAYEIQNRTDLTPEVRANALATLNKTSTQITSYQTAAVKSLKDEVNSTLAVVFVQPDALKPGQLAAFADRASSLGEQELATRYRLLAAMEGTIKNGLAAAPQEQINMLKHMSEGLPKQLLEGMGAGNADALAKANDGFSALKKAQGDGLAVEGLKDRTQAVAQMFADAGKGEKAREVSRWYGAALAASDTLKANPVAQKQAMAEIEAVAAKGQATEQQFEGYHLLKEGIARQEQAFKDDGYSAGRKLYGLPVLPMEDGRGRAQQAAQISAARNGVPIAAMTQEEIAALKAKADGSPHEAAKVFQAIAANYPADTIPLIAAGLAGKGDASDPVSRGYAAAMSFYADKSPVSTEIANQILGGVALTKAEAGKKAPTSNQAWSDTLKERMGNVFRDMPGKTTATIRDAIAMVYTYQMNAAGRSGDKIDTDVLDNAAQAVVGKTITHRGQMVLPPRGVDIYDFDKAVRSLRDSDLAGLRTTEGDPITADVVIRRGMLTNAGEEGQYFVRIPDPRAGMEPRMVINPDGSKYRIDLKPLVERSKQAPPPLADTSPAAARRRAPVLTDNVQP